jgi:hypothetical protein
MTAIAIAWMAARHETPLARLRWTSFRRVG